MTDKKSQLPPVAVTGHGCFCTAIYRELKAHMGNKQILHLQACTQSGWRMVDIGEGGDL